MIRLRLETRSLLREYDFHRDEIRIGRSPLNDLSIPDEGVSARHALLRLQDGALIFEDLDSRTGTALLRAGRQDQLLRPTALEPGDALLLGPFARLTLLTSDEEHTLQLLHTPFPAEPAPLGELAAPLAALALAQVDTPELMGLLQGARALLQQAGLRVLGQGILRVREDFLRLWRWEDPRLTACDAALADDERLQLLALLTRGGLIAHRHQGAWRLYLTARDATLPQRLSLVFEVALDGDASPLALAQPLLDPLGRLLRGLAREESLLGALDGTQAENRYFRDRQRRHYLFKELVTRSEPMRAIYDRVHDLSALDAPVLIHGEAGTGKEMLARALHHLGPRREQLMVSQSCADMDPLMLDIELFGVGEGQGAHARPSLFELARGGTVFLDEIDRLPPLLQLKLLRLLREGEVRRQGEECARPVQVRLVLTTHRDLKPLAERGELRHDLFVALKEHELWLPALRDRRDDILPLALNFVEVFARRYNALATSLTPDAERALLQHPWPGNVRELRSAAELAVLKHPQGPLRAEDFGL
jgi:hypothetical protein